MRRTNNNEIIRIFQSILYLLVPFRASAQFIPVTENLPQIIPHISPSVERRRQMVMLQLMPEPYRPFIIQTGITDKYEVFFVLLHNLFTLMSRQGMVNNLN